MIFVYLRILHFDMETPIIFFKSRNFLFDLGTQILFCSQSRTKEVISHASIIDDKSEDKQQVDNIPNLGVFTPDSTTNSVHSMHGYGGPACSELDHHLSLESPASVSSSDMQSNVAPPSVEMGQPSPQQTHFHHHHMSTLHQPPPQQVKILY
jgi:hypothetical protein